MQKYSAAYSYINYNFVIQNIDNQQKKRNINNKYYPIVCVLKNIIQRGCPTKMSQYLKEQIGDIDIIKEKKIFGLIDKDIPKWINTIKGDESKNNYPAKIFFEEIIPKYLEEYKFIQKLIVPEAKISEITDTENEEFINQQVDFYLHQCKLVIEIDGSGHKETIQQIKDKERDEFLYSHGVSTIRITTKEIAYRNESFINKMLLIKQALQKNDKKLSIYKNYIDLSNYDDKDIKYFKVGAVIRLQIAILELLQRGVISLDDKLWKINILQRDIDGFCNIAIEDLFIWFENLFILNNMEFNRPEIEILESHKEDIYTFDIDSINIDFSLLKRYTDENELNKNVIYIRNDYFDGKRYFRVSSTDPICYNINRENIRCIKSLEFLLKNIFGHDNFRDGQLPIIINSLQGEDTIGILPTGTGKSVCYQLTALLQPCISYVVCPIKSLIYDQKINLNKNNIDNIECITGDLEANKKDKIIKDFSDGKYQFIFISPERFQMKNFRESLEQLNRFSNLGLAVIDEVHCLSEWGHDFRTSYLNLIKTIRRFTPSIRLLGLTATASNFVLQDIKREFEIECYNVKTLTSFTRKELNFKVIKCIEEEGMSKRQILFDILEDLQSNKNVFNLNGDETKSGIVFTSTVNGSKGCYQISNAINKKFNVQSQYYSGESPTIGTYPNKKPLFESKEYNKYKNKIQKDFKENKLPLLVATKAFGMGVDKPNIRYTIHFGMPMSLESLYQEAGRAGRDKKSADCFVIYEDEIIDKECIDKFFSLDVPIEELIEIQKNINSNKQKDILSSFFLWLSNNKGIEYELLIIKKIYEMYAKPNITSKIECKKIGYNLTDVQKAIYRLCVIGIIEDWTIDIWDSKKGVIEVIFNDFNIDTMNNHLEQYIKKYNKEFNLDTIYTNNITIEKKTHYNMSKVLMNDELLEYERIVNALLIWVYDNIIYTRRQSIKTISDLCRTSEDGELFKKAIENHFKFDDDTYILDYVAENPTDYNRWFEAIRNSKGEFNKEQIKALKGTLGRFLESYRYNTGLNYISGIIRLILDDYDNMDGKQRLEDAFKSIRNYDENIKNEILIFSLDAGKLMDIKNRTYLSMLLCDNFDNTLEIYESLKDDYSLGVIIEENNKKLECLCRRLKCQKQEA